MVDERARNAEFDHARDYAWNSFEYHAKQRMDVFRFYLVVVGLVFLAAFRLAESDKDVLAIAVFAFLIFSTYLFYRMDVRGRRLVKIAEEYLKNEEERLSRLLLCSSITIISNADRESKSLQGTGKLHEKPFVSFSQLFNSIYLSVSILCVIAIAYIVFNWSSSMKQPALDPATLEPRVGSSYPEEFRALVAAREKRALGEALGLQNFGVNLVRLPPGCASSQRHWHTRQDEFVYVLEGELTLVTDAGEQALGPGTAAGFPAGKADGHHLVNRSQRDALYLEVGDRAGGDECDYPDIDLAVRWIEGEERFVHKDGRLY